MSEPTVVVSPSCQWCAAGDKAENIEGVGNDVHTIYTTCGSSPLIQAAAANHAERLVEAFWEGLEASIKAELRHGRGIQDRQENDAVQRCLDAAKRYRDQVTF